MIHDHPARVPRKKKNKMPKVHILYLVPLVEAWMEGQISAEHLQIQPNCYIHQCIMAPAWTHRRVQHDPPCRCKILWTPSPRVWEIIKHPNDLFQKPQTKGHSMSLRWRPLRLQLQSSSVRESPTFWFKPAMLEISYMLELSLIHCKQMKHPFACILQVHLNFNSIQHS